MKMPFQKMVIIGVGLMGGSLGMAVRERKLAREVTGVDLNSAALDRAMALHAIDHAERDLRTAADHADVVVLATPTGYFAELARELSRLFHHRTIVTDMGSVKGAMVETLEHQLSPYGCFVGGHPITGREKSGVEAASAGLFDGAPCILTPTPRTDPEALEAIKSLWEAVGCRVTLMNPERHDRILAVISHLPHIAAYALVNLLLEMDTGEPDLLNYSAGGLRDFTRIAASSPEMWRDICLANGDQIVNRIEEYRKALDHLKQMILERDSSGLKEAFERAKVIRERLNKQSA